MKSFETTRVQDHQKNFLAHELCQSTSKKQITTYKFDGDMLEFASSYHRFDMILQKIQITKTKL